MISRNIRLLSVFNFLIGLTFFAPLAIIYFEKVSGSYTLATSIFGVIMLSAALFEVPTGILSDRVGRRSTIIIGSWARVAGFTLYALGFNYWTLFLGAIFEGLSRAFYSGNNEAFLYDTLADNNQKDKFQEYLGKTSSTEHAGLALSAVFGSVIASVSFSYVMWLAVASQIAMLIISYFFTEPKITHQKSTNIYSHLGEAIAIFKRNSKLRMLSISTILSNSFSELAYQFRGAFYITVWPIWALGISNVLSDIFATIGFAISGRVLKKVYAEKLIFYRSLIDKIINFISLIYPTIASPVILSTTSLLYGVGQVALNDLKQREYTNHQRATMNSLVSLGRSIGASVMTLALGGAADQFGARNALLIFLGLSTSVTLVNYKIYRNSQNQ